MVGFKKICAEIIGQVIEEFYDNVSRPATEDNINESERPEADKEVQIVKKETLFYIHMQTICPIFMKQPMSLTKGRVVIHCIRHAEVRTGVAFLASPFHNRRFLLAPPLQAEN
jgi:hypothetical protein